MSYGYEFNFKQLSDFINHEKTFPVRVDAANIKFYNFVKESKDEIDFEKLETLLDMEGEDEDICLRELYDILAHMNFVFEDEPLYFDFIGGTNNCFIGVSLHQLGDKGLFEIRNLPKGFMRKDEVPKINIPERNSHI